jgi:hypothetical protein
MKRAGTKSKAVPTSAEFFALLRWLNGRPLLETIEPYRRRIFEEVLDTMDGDRPRYNLALCGRAKKNWKTSDLILAALYRFLVWPSSAGNDCFILANDEGQAADDLSLAKKLIAANPILEREVLVLAKSITRKDGRGSLIILPAGDVVGSHGKTALFVGFDEIHGYRTHDLFEALAPDPTRRDALIWITSYAGIRHAPGIPLYDFLQAGKRGDDPRMFFSWHAADFGTDSAFAELPEPEQRANPSISCLVADYLAQQKRRLPAHKYRRLHLNLPGAPDGAAFSGEHVMAAIVPGRKHLARVEGIAYKAFCDMSGGSNDDAVLGVAHSDPQTGRIVLDALVSQTGRPPFNPRPAVKKFVGVLRSYGIAAVTGDAFAGETFRRDFEEQGVAYRIASLSKSDLYDALEPKLNAGEVELLDIHELQEQLLTLVWRGTKIDHLPGDHDDFANAAAGVAYLCGSAMSTGEAWVQFYKKMGDAARDGTFAERYAQFGPAAERRIANTIRAREAARRERKAAEAPPRVDVFIGKPYANFFISGEVPERYSSDEAGWVRGVRPEHRRFLPERQPPEGKVTPAD